MAHQIVRCRYCNSSEVVHYGTQSGHDRFRCKTCRRIFKTEYTYRACEPGVKEQIRPMATNGSGVRDTSRVLGIGKNTVISDLKKSATEAVDVNPHIGVQEIAPEVRHLFDSPREVQIDEQWSHVGGKDRQRWLWRAIDAATGVALAFVFGRRQDEVCQRLMDKLKVFNIQKYYTDDWGSYAKFIPEGKPVIGKANTQKIENRNLQLRTRIKRLARRTMCFSKSEEIHDAVIGLFINKYCFDTA
jgi:insertion element IS1 protein InsB